MSAQMRVLRLTRSIGSLGRSIAQIGNVRTTSREPALKTTATCESGGQPKRLNLSIVMCLVFLCLAVRSKSSKRAASILRADPSLGGPVTVKA